MANSMISKDFGKHKISKVFKDAVAENDLGAGISGGFAVVGYKGKVWSVRRAGEDEILMRDDGDGPRSSIDVAIVSSATVLSKTWYEKGYVEGSSAPPDCWSGNGITPNPTSPKLQSPTCATCPRNVWGGKITENNKRTKECGDAKRMAVVFIDDIVEEDTQPMLLRTPAASLADLSSYGAEISKLGYPYYSVATKINFDPEESYPKFVFTAIRPLTDEEAERVMEMRGNALVDRILDQTNEAVMVDGAMITQALPPKQLEKPSPKVIQAEAETAPAKGRKPKATAEAPPKKSAVTPRKAAMVAAEEVEDAEVVSEDDPVAALDQIVGNGEEEEDAFDKSLDDKLSAFLSDDE